MPSIALFFSTHTFEKKIKEELVAKLDLHAVSDRDIVRKASELFHVPEAKLQHSLYDKTSVFNKFTLEREMNTAYLKTALSTELLNSDLLITGFCAHLIPKTVSHVLKILVVDERENRIRRAIGKGLVQHKAEKDIHQADVSAYHWTDFVADAEPWDSKLYDAVIPVKDQTPEDIVAFILEQCAQVSLIETKESIQAVHDMIFGAEIETNLLQKGQKATVHSKENHITIEIHKSVLNFSALAKEISDHVSAIEKVKSVKVVMGKDYNDSIYRDQEFKLPPKVLLVDDEKEFATTLSERLINRNVGAYAVYDGQEALDFLTSDQPDVMVLDLKMPGISGMEVLQHTKEKNPGIEIIILTGHGTDEDKKNCLDLGAFAYLQKPTDIQTLSETIHKAYEKSAPPTV